jgi:DNA-directed RNA polymerase specialized sigma24 family protein
MWDDGERTFRAFATVTSRELRGQAYLLTGDPASAESLAERALAATHLQYRQGGLGGVDEFARAELVRSFVADSYESGRPAAAAAAQRFRQAVNGYGGHTAVWEALQSLSPRRRAVIVLRYDEGLSEAQIADRLGRTPSSIMADAEAGMLTLRTALRGQGEPGDLVPAALAEAGYHWSEWFTPADERAAAAARPADRPPSPPPAAKLGKPSHTPWVLATVALAVLAVLTPILGMSVLRNRADQGSPGAGQQSSHGVFADQAGAAPQTRIVAPGLLNWQPTGSRATEPAALLSASAIWEAHARPQEAPASGMTTLYAGPLDGREVVLMQALDRAGRPRVAQLEGPSLDRLSLVHAEPLSPTAAAITIAPSSGPGGRLRVLVAPQARFDGGLLATGNVPQGPLAPVPVNSDGVSRWLPSPPGAPTCSQIAVLQPSGSGDVHKPRVLVGGIVRADMMGILTGEVRIGPSSLIGEAAVAPDSTWFEDGALLASTAGWPIVVGALGPRLPARPVSDMEKRLVESRLYEVRRGSQLSIGSVVRFDGRPVCVSVIPLGAAGVQRPLTGIVARCALPTHLMEGVLAVVGGPGTESVRVNLNATRSPAGQMPYKTTVARPARTPAGAGWAALAIDPEMFPCGTGVVHADGGGVSAIGALPVYIP